MAEQVPEEQEPGEEQESYEVGYRHPPLHSRFRPGRSGNPRGRPKGKRSLESILREVLGKKVTLSVNGKRKRVTVQTAILMRQSEQALKGDLKSARLLLELSRACFVDQDADGERQPLSEEDIEILASAGLQMKFGNNDDGGP